MEAAGGRHWERFAGSERLVANGDMGQAGVQEDCFPALDTRYASWRRETTLRRRNRRQLHFSRTSHARTVESGSRESGPSAYGESALI
jgi:hypothetical protein